MSNDSMESGGIGSGERDRQPIFNVPGAVLILTLAMVAIHIALMVIPDGLSEWWTLALAFIPSRYGASLFTYPGAGWAPVTSWLTHAFVHGDVMHLGMNTAFFLAFGAACVRRLGNLRFIALMIASTVAGALAYVAINGFAEVVLVGASGAISGLVGAVLRFLYPALTLAPGARLADAASVVPRLSLSAMWRETQPRRTVLAWLVLNLVLALVLPAAGMSGNIAWEAHLGGFLVGLLAFDLFDSGRPAIDVLPGPNWPSAHANDDEPTAA